MFSTWLTLRQAQEALRNGRLDEAFQIANQPAIKEHRRAGELMQQVGQALVARGQLHMQHDDDRAAWKDLLQAEAAGVQDKAAVKLRQDLIRRGINETKSFLDAGEPTRAVELARDMQDHGVQAPDLKVVAEAAEGWSLAIDLAARGEFSQAMAVLERIARHGSARLEEFRIEVKKKQRLFDSVITKLHQALEQGKWREVIGLADEALAIAPQHSDAKRARAKAWRAVEPPTAVYAGGRIKHEPRSDRPEDNAPPRRMLLWIDGVGGYLVCLSPRVSFGQATPEAYVDIPLFADVSRLHGYLTRDQEGYLLEAVRTIRVNNEQVEKAILKDGDRLTIGASCQMQFHQPVAVSGTARLEIASGHRLALSVDGVILMAETCILGPGPDAHIEMPDLRKPVVLFRRKEGLGVRYDGQYTVDGNFSRDRVALGLGSTVAGDDFRFTLEPLEAQLGSVKA
jgi:tetratricopeptide (TPR) repeat protein